MQSSTTFSTSVAAPTCAPSSRTRRKFGQDITNTNLNKQPEILDKSKANSKSRSIPFREVCESPTNFPTPSPPPPLSPDTPISRHFEVNDTYTHLEDTDNYVQDIHSDLRKKELAAMVSPSYMQKQAQINEEMRAHLVHWLVKVHHNFHCVQETLYLAINLIDRFLELKNAQRSEFQLIGVAAFMVAVKYEETSSSSSLDPRDLVQLMEGRHSLKDLVSMEFNILSVLDFKITIATAHGFLVQYSNAANANLDMVKIASFLTERVLQEFTMVQYLPSMVASCAIYLARLHLNLDPWSSNLLKFTGYTEKNLLSCYNQMLVILKTKTTLTAVELKYDLETCRVPEKS